ncbi:MAG: hypothetical protein V4640_04675 [Verrucomicrobiota bacterium]
MIPELPSHLHSTRDLLIGSLGTHPVEKASAMPTELLSELVSRFEATTVVKAPSLSWFDKIQSFVSRPAFGVAAFAAVILAFVLPTMVAPVPTGSGFRGATSEASSADSVRIVLIQAPSQVVSSLENSGDFEKGAISAINSLPSDQTGPRVVVDFSKSEISIIRANGEVISTEALPNDSAALSGAIASAVSRL